MEKFAVDLDRVLDEFELNEDLESVGSKEPRLQNHAGPLPPLYAGDLYPQHDQGSSLPPLIPSPSILDCQFGGAFEPDATLDLSEADFAPSPLPTTVLGSYTLADTYEHQRPTTNFRNAIESPSGLQNSDETFSTTRENELEQLLDFTVTPTVPATGGPAAGLSLGSSPTSSRRDSTEHRNGEVASGSAESETEAHPHSARPSSSKHDNEEVVDGIKVLHCDETINRDYLVTFGRRRDVPAAGAAAPAVRHYDAPAAAANDAVDDDEGIVMGDDSRDEDSVNAPESKSPDPQPPTAEAVPRTNCANEDNHVGRPVSLDTTERTKSSTASGGERSDGGDAWEETFVTPDDGAAMVGQFLAAPVGFGNLEVDVSDEDLRRYLEESCLAGEEEEEEELGAVAATPDGGVGDRSPAGREEFFTPPLEKPLDGAALVRETLAPGSASRRPSDPPPPYREFEEDVSQVVPQSKPETSSAHQATAQASDRRSSTDTTGPEATTTPTTTPSSPHPELAQQSRSPSQSEKEQVNRELRLQLRRELCLRATNTTPAVEPAEVAPRVQEEWLAAETLSASPADEGWEDDNDLQPYPSSELRSDEGADDGGGDPDQRLTRPTSLHLSTKIDVEPPSVQSDDTLPTPAELEEHLPFASLVATAGSPDAVALSDDCETPGVSAANSNLSEEERLLGKIAPLWVPDAEAPNCMYCGMKFTVIKRRHHCRACGKVLCAQCCGTKAKLHYMENKEARVCLACLEIMQKVQDVWGRDGEGSGDPLGPPGYGAAAAAAASSPSLAACGPGPNPNNPSEYCSVIPPLQQARANAGAHPPTVMVPVGVLKRGGGGRPKGEPKQVMFSDGIRPGGDLTELDGAEPRLPYRRQGRLQKRVEKTPGQVSQMPRTCLPTVDQREYTLEDSLDMEHVMTILKDDAEEPLVFAVANNLKVLLKIVSLDCCVHKVCWCFATRGLCAVGQDEIVILLEVQPDEKVLPYGVFHHIIDVYEDASKGHSVSSMGHTVLTRSFLGSKDHGGFLYIRPTFQCLQKLPLPPSPYLFGILLQKWEIPWAKVFPLRLLLRLGAEFRYYPCPLVGVRSRKPVFCEIGHTIVNLLADFRNYQYSLPAIPGLLIHMDDKNTYIMFPRNRYDEVVKALNSSIDHVMSLAASFSSKADSHLVCIQNEDGNYQTQAINIKDKPRKVTGASFVVFNGALKTSSGLTAKSSIVEDGMMVQISSESMLALRQALRDMKDYTVECGPIGAAQPEEVVHLQWVDDDRNVNMGVKSPLDGMSMDGVSSIRIHCGTDYVNEGYLIRWTEVYLVRTDDAAGSRRSDPVDVSKVSDTLAQACCVALAPHLESLCAEGLSKIALRVTLDSENVGYEIGAGGTPLPSVYMNDLDSELVPAMHSAASPTQEGSIMLELIFHVLQH